MLQEAFCEQSVSDQSYHGKTYYEISRIHQTFRAGPRARCSGIAIIRQLSWYIYQCKHRRISRPVPTVGNVFQSKISSPFIVKKGRGDRLPNITE